jgi:hypothetical protein
VIVGEGFIAWRPNSVALFSPSTGFKRSAIMTNALAAAREARAWQVPYASRPNSLKTGFKPSFAMSRVR